MTYVLGISAFYHDSAAALLIDGKIIAAAQEERFTRIKHDSNYPRHAVNFVLKNFNRMIGGEIFVPKIPSYNIITLVKTFKKNANIKMIGLRPGEKLHEEMISIHDSMNTIEAKDHFVILPNVSGFDYNIDSYIGKKRKISSAET